MTSEQINPDHRAPRALHDLLDGACAVSTVDELCKALGAAGGRELEIRPVRPLPAALHPVPLATEPGQDLVYVRGQAGIDEQWHALLHAFSHRHLGHAEPPDFIRWLAAVQIAPAGAAPPGRLFAQTGYTEQDEQAAAGWTRTLLEHIPVPPTDTSHHRPPPGRPGWVGGHGS